MVSYIKKCVSLCLAGTLCAMVTCPVTKTGLHEAGYPFPGHTELIAALTGSAEVAMMFSGSRLRVALATRHCPLGQVPSLLNHHDLYQTIELVYTSLMRDFGLAAPRIGVAGVNPHAGEQALFGWEEDKIITPVINQAKQAGISVTGPLPPDTIFHHALAGKYDCVVAMYHDQGLIPFKLLHFQDGVNVSIGLPIVRTSVDHGTAYDIAGKGLADESSLYEALLLAHKIARNRLKINQ
jgi:4-hydroxythreonine-4-phosphate dehydrogenase